MKKTIFLIAMIFSVSLFAQDVQLRWEKDLDIATQLAKDQNKPILIYFTKTDCKSCQQFYMNVLKSDEFASLSNKFVLLMVDGTNKDDIKNSEIEVIRQRRLIIHYNKQAQFPAMLVVNENGETISETMTDENELQSYISFLKTL